MSILLFILICFSPVVCIILLIAQKSVIKDINDIKTNINLINDSTGTINSKVCDLLYTIKVSDNSLTIDSISIDD